MPIHGLRCCANAGVSPQGHRSAAAMRQAFLHALEESDGFFLSHAQSQAAIQVMSLQQQLQERLEKFLLARTAAQKVERKTIRDPLVWLDQDQEPTLHGMQKGVRQTKNFLVFLTTDYFTRHFCRVSYSKEIALCLGVCMSFVNFTHL
eukprot:SAG31_NODE_9232_length_1312_cov_1.483924_2_plen_148_part_00